MTSSVHHIELWTTDLPATAPSFDWLLTELGWSAEADDAWTEGRIWTAPDGVYLVLEQSPAVSAPHDRTTGGLNHLALRTGSRDHLDRLRVGCTKHGWSELFADAFPHAGGPDSTALYLENAQGFEVEVVWA